MTSDRCNRVHTMYAVHLTYDNEKPSAVSETTLLQVIPKVIGLNSSDTGRKQATFIFRIIAEMIFKVDQGHWR